MEIRMAELNEACVMSVLFSRFHHDFTNVFVIV